MYNKYLEIKKKKPKKKPETNSSDRFKDLQRNIQAKGRSCTGNLAIKPNTETHSLQRD